MQTAKVSLNLLNTLLKITPAPLLFESKYPLWSCSDSCRKPPTPSGVDSCTPDPAFLWSVRQR